ncbi:MAG: molybdopterin-dependent oxidoreductase [Gaiellaceae bacterium]
MEPPGAPVLRPYGRRAFLGVLVAGFAALLGGHPVQRLGELFTPVEGAFGFGGWRIYTIASTMPRFDPTTWRLRIDGLVEKPQNLTYADLVALPQAAEVKDFHCVTGWSVPHVHWGGVRIRHLLALARPLPQARALRFVSAESPYEDSLTLDQALLHDVMLAHRLDRKPLSRPHGAPLRLVIPEMYGYKGVKWLERIELTAEPVNGYWEQRGYDRDAWVGRSNGRG